MKDEMLRGVLESGQAKTDKDGWAVMPEGRSLTLYVAHDGVPLTVAKVDRVRLVPPVVRARNLKGETFFLSLDDVFAAALDGTESGGARKPGFLGG